MHLMTLVNNDSNSFQLLFGTFDEHLYLLNADNTSIVHQSGVTRLDDNVQALSQTSIC